MMKRPKNPLMSKNNYWGAYEKGVKDTLAINQEEWDRLVKLDKKDKNKTEKDSSKRDE